MSQPPITPIGNIGINTGTDTVQSGSFTLPSGEWLIVAFGCAQYQGSTSISTLTFAGQVVPVQVQSIPGVTHGGNRCVGIAVYKNGTGGNLTGVVEGKWPVAHPKIFVDPYKVTGLNATVFVGSSSHYTTNNGQASPALSVTTAVDDLVFDVLGGDYFAGGGTNPTDLLSVSGREDSSLSNYFGVSWRYAGGSTTIAQWQTTYNYGVAHAGIALKTAVVGINPLASLVFTTIGPVSASVGQQLQVKAKLLTANGTPSVGSTLIISGVSPSIATYTPSVLTTDANGEVLITFNGVGPGTFVISGTATDGVTSITATSGGLAISAGLGGVDLLDLGTFVNTITTPDTVSYGTAGTAYSLNNTATGAAPLAWSATGLPGGVTISPTSGLLSGTPAAPGVYNIVITCTDSTGQTDTHAIVLGVKGTAELEKQGTVGATSNITATVTGGNTPNTISLQAGPSWMTWSGLVGSGTPTAPGYYTGVVQGCSSTANCAAPGGFNPCTSHTFGILVMP
jgi:Putative Ig domain